MGNCPNTQIFECLSPRFVAYVDGVNLGFYVSIFFKFISSRYLNITGRFFCWWIADISLKPGMQLQLNVNLTDNVMLQVETVQ